ncbi:hypothetical protein GXW71_30610 [Roseomonas hellenica]|uniref:Uncharacterized protein n=1 Tax=Plastoroseomonas hellenica TaxID=2687306 RepID=A0ABS5F8C0_9PROT|nr:hypothetical protein [Plastoroseomonas hellenica]MBR0668741.1 hypothetical protein [Plastoroseomonas hellenica]
MSESLSDAGPPARPASPPTYKIVAAPSGEAAGFLVIETGPGGHEVTLLACATRDEASRAKTALEQLDAAEARARGWRAIDRS